MSIPEKCTVLVVGGGPGGSYAASALAREGINTVLLESDVHPRYHIGESMLPSLRHFLRFIDCDETFLQHGFTKKVGAAFSLNQANYEGYTDFIAEGGPNHYTWNVIRSEADELLFRHAAKSGANAFEGVKVNSVEFVSSTSPNSKLGRPVSASYTRKLDGTNGVINFDYIIDASGRVGILNTKYLKNRMYNQGLKNVANWAYWRATGKYGEGTPRENSPYFEALTDESGWAWFIPLHNGTHSVGVVMNQEKMTKKKTASSLSTEALYRSSLKLVPRLNGYLTGGEMVTEVKSASDYSYNSSSYAFPYGRVVGDAGCFIDPFFSSGVHLAITSALSAATTICAAIRGDCDEDTAGAWHSTKVKEGYSRWLLVVLSAYEQMCNQGEQVLSDFGEDNFDRAFNFFKPIIQGTADVSTKLTQAEFSSALNFVVKAFDRKGQSDLTSEQERKAFDEIRKTQSQNMDNIQSFTMDVIDGRLPRLSTGKLGLNSVAVTTEETKYGATVTVSSMVPEEQVLME
ncbi:aromatic-ring hydroxylase-like protein [Coleophoma cylindrospora]|uniref:Aromatic-ring hydroxylase-like protein n=1 Tax=Coleophoma cylindrospora TaxID=1849047 RepID=A0A3D8S6C7_9HELO|nr:aromatic-ring hydroxylase-like protein [Coleophoma cylindrospora]